jgi:hypothetical protein
MSSNAELLFINSGHILYVFPQRVYFKKKNTQHKQNTAITVPNVFNAFYEHKLKLL